LTDRLYKFGFVDKIVMDALRSRAGEMRIVTVHWIHGPIDSREPALNPVNRGHDPQSWKKR
jgi:hypothetical protein